MVVVKGIPGREKGNILIPGDELENKTQGYL